MAHDNTIIIHDVSGGDGQEGAESSGNTFSGGNRLRDEAIKIIQESASLSMKDYVDAKHETALARIEAVSQAIVGHIREVIGEITGMAKSIDAKSSKLDVWLVGLAVVGALMAFLAFGGDRFDGGVQASSVSVWQAEEARRQSDANRESISALTVEVEKTNSHLLSLTENIDRLLGEDAKNSEAEDE